MELRDKLLRWLAVLAVPAHAGLGSGTQLALAVASGLRTLHRLPEDIHGDMAALQRGARSGIGIGAFGGGGLVVDGGRGAQTKVPPIVARSFFPEHWRVIVLLDTDGSEDAAAFPKTIAAANTFPPLEVHSLTQEVAKVGSDMYISLALANMRIYLVGGLILALVAIIAIAMAKYSEDRRTLALRLHRP